MIGKSRAIFTSLWLMSHLYNFLIILGLSTLVGYGSVSDAILIMTIWGLTGQILSPLKFYRRCEDESGRSVKESESKHFNCDSRGLIVLGLVFSTLPIATFAFLSSEIQSISPAAFLGICIFSILFQALSSLSENFVFTAEGISKLNTLLHGAAAVKLITSVLFYAILNNATIAISAGLFSSAIYTIKPAYSILPQRLREITIIEVRTILKFSLGLNLFWLIFYLDIFVATLVLPNSEKDQYMYISYLFKTAFFVFHLLFLELNKNFAALNFKERFKRYQIIVFISLTSILTFVAYVISRSDLYDVIILGYPAHMFVEASLIWVLYLLAFMCVLIIETLNVPVFGRYVAVFHASAVGFLISKFLPNLFPLGILLTINLSLAYFVVQIYRALD